MKLQELLSFVVGALEELEIPFMLTGALAASYHGSPRATQDVDLVVDADASLLLQLAARLREEDLYVSDQAVSEAARSRGQFNAIDPASGWKVDFIVRKNRPFSQAEFRERQRFRFMDLELTITRAEDLIVAKLEWSKLGNSERQLYDVAEILAVQGSRLNYEDIDHWVRELSLENQWLRARELS